MIFETVVGRKDATERNLVDAGGLSIATDAKNNNYILLLQTFLNSSLQ